MEVISVIWTIVILTLFLIKEINGKVEISTNMSSAKIFRNFYIKHFPASISVKRDDLDSFEDGEEEDNNNRTARHSNHHRQHTDCGFQCNDGSCIKSSSRCDSVIDCLDVSDEIDCLCIDRIGTSKLCDGFEDCPLGEDEQGCGFGCGDGMFSCNEGKTGLTSTNCISESQKCDGHKDCPNARDESLCWRLTSFDLTVRGILPEGVLQKNIGGEWHTICPTGSAAESHWLKRYARKTCEIIIGDLDESPKTSKIKVDSVTMSEELLQIEPLIYTKLVESETKFSKLEKCSIQKLYKVECPEPKCGWPASKYDKPHSRARRDLKGLTAKIVGGTNSIHGEWPFIVGIFRNGAFHCGASIINKNWIITAAHCTHGFEKYVFEAQVGMTRRYSWSPHEHTRLIKRIYVHERYDSKIFLHDIALMEVESPFYLSKWVTPACFPNEKSQDPSGSNICRVVGWGDLSEEGDSPDYLQEVELPILHQCMETFTKDHYQICAGVMEGGKDACQGDSGGPLICKDSLGRSIVNGLVSFGRGCARPNQAGVYTRISSYHSWIESIISGENPSVDHVPRPKECQTKCFRSGGECLLDRHVCNQEVDCLGVDDELNCNYIGTSRAHGDNDEPDESAYEHIRHTAHATEEHTHEYGSAKLCGPNEYQCKTTLSCIPIQLKCNGKPECSDSTDEKQCECGEIIEKVFPQYKCDNIDHCLDRTDEVDCDSQKVCNGATGMIKCPFSDECVKESRWCDGTAHCKFGEDEADCVRITKSKNKLPGEGYLNDKISRGLQSGYVVIRESGNSWRAACIEDFGDNMNAIVCPYLGLGTEQNSPLSQARSPNQRVTRDTKKCTQIKVQCGEPECGRNKLYSLSTTRPPGDYLGSLPWIISILVEGNPVCAGTMVSKHWIIVFSSCIDSNVRSISNEYISAIAGFSKATYIVMGPMEQARRVNSIVRFENEFALLRVESPFSIDHLATPICTDVGNYINHAYCTMINVRNGTDIDEYLVRVDPSCETDDYNCILIDDKRYCQNAEGSSVYCTADGTSWFLLGFVNTQGLSKCLDKGRIQLVNPFYGTKEKDTKRLLSRPPSSLVKAPGCTGTRCSFGNCVANPYVCDGIAHCPDYLDEKRCQRHYQVLRTQDDDNNSPNYGLSENGTCPDGHFQCRSTLNCVPIAAFCDEIYDCGPDDFTDEPLNEEDCSCRYYLELVAPERICDDKGKEHCPDRGDEHGCPCKPDSFVCQSNSGNPTECIHRNLICDSFKDCSNGKDEEHCMAVSKSLDVISVDTSKDELEGYVLVQVKGSWHPYCSDQWSLDFGEKICNHFGFRTLVHLNTIELEDLNSIIGTGANNEESDGEEDETIGGREVVLLLLGDSKSNIQDAGPIDEVISKASDDEEYQCTVAHLHCSKL